MKLPLFPETLQSKLGKSKLCEKNTLIFENGMDPVALEEGEDEEEDGRTATGATEGEEEVQRTKIRDLAAVNISNLSTSSQQKEPNESYKLVMKIIHEGLKYIKRDPRTSSHVISAIKVLEDEANEEEEDEEEEALEEEDEDEEGYQQTMMGN